MRLFLTEQGKIVNQICAAYRALTVVLAIIAGALIVLITVLIGAEAFSRAFGFGVIRGVVDIAEHSMFCIALLSAPWILTKNGHISINLLTSQISDKANSLLSIFTEGLCTLLCVLIAYEGLFIFLEGYHTGELVYADLIFPDWWLLWQTPLAFALMAIEFARRTVCALKGKNLHAAPAHEADHV